MTITVKFYEMFSSSGTHYLELEDRSMYISYLQISRCSLTCFVDISHGRSIYKYTSSFVLENSEILTCEVSFLSLLEWLEIITQGLSK